MTEKQPNSSPAREQKASENLSGLSFEVCLDRLENIVKELESGEQPLERSLELFEEGMKLSASCRRRLEEAESRVEILLKKNDGKIIPEPFNLGNDEQSS